MRILFYILAVSMANIVTAKFAPLNIGIIVPWGTLFIGLTFVLRDLVQLKHGRRTAYMSISAALIISALTSHLLGDTLMIVAASAISFAIAETTDTEVFTRWKGSIQKRIIFSGTAGSVLDSVIFAVVGLIPAGYITWEVLPMAVLGQVIVKTIMQFVCVLFFKKGVEKC
jgi:hypothetical protein